MTSGQISGMSILQQAWALYRSDIFVLTAVPFVANVGLNFISLAFSQITGRPALWPDLVFGPLVLAVVIVLARDAARGARQPFSDTLAAVTPHFGKLILLSFAAAIIVAVGLVLLIIPGLYAAGVLLAYVPFVLFQGAGWGALGRCYEASKPHAWQLVGLILILMVIILGLLIVGGGIVGMLQSLAEAPILWSGIILLGSGAFTGFYACVMLITYGHITGESEGDVSDVFR